MVVLEALACGAAVIASPNGGLREAGGDAAIYLDPLDELAFARALADLANDPERLGDLQDAGVVHAAQNTWAARYQDLVEAVAVSFR